MKQGEGRDLARSSEDWLAWLTRELGRRQGPPRLRLLALWDVLEEWFATEDFAGSEVAAAVAAAPDGRGQATRAALARHRLAVRRLLEELATAAGARDAAVLAAQLQVLVEGAIVGALIDRHPGVARHGRELTEMALGSPAPRAGAATAGGEPSGPRRRRP